jgi:Tfp pilus assembly protein PilZ
MLGDRILKMNKTPHFLAIINNDKAKKNCLEQLKTNNATYDFIEKLEDLSKIPVSTKFHGIIIDIHRLFQLSSLDRAFLKLYASELPTLKFVWNVKNDSLVVTHTSLVDLEKKDLSAFVKNCSQLPACAIRRERRYSVILNAMIDELLVNINNISKHGCFVMTTINSFNIGDEILLTVKEFNDEPPIPCLIHRIVEWGNKDLAAGIGVEFLSMTEIQRTELDTILSEGALKMEKDMENDVYS